ncbi:MAG: hypothetical protein L0K86_22340 [Actinomycetia bacterium]|nr:hypothetical protein [Actinomycetes bacterium]
MTVIAVPFHLDEPLPGFVPPLAPDAVVAPDLPAGTPWERMAVSTARSPGTSRTPCGPGGCRSCGRGLHDVHGVVAGM